MIRFKYPIIPLLALVPLALLSGCQSKEPPAEKPAEEKGHEEKGHAEGEKHDEGGDAHGGIVLSDSAKKSAGIRTQAALLRPMQATQDVPGIVEIAANRTIKLTPNAPGKIVSLLAKPGDRVQVGQVLALLDSFEVAQGHASVEEAEAAIAQATASFQTAQAEARQAAAGIKVAEAAIDQAQERVKSARQAVSRQRELASAGAFAQAPLQAAQVELSEAQSELLKNQTELQGHVVVLQRAERLFKEEVISKAELEQAQLEQRQDEANVERTRRRIESARITLEREKKIATAGLLNAREVQTAEAVLRDTEADVRKARSERNQSVEVLRKAERGVAAARTSLAGTQAALRAARTSLYALEGSDHAPGRGGRVVVKAPISGIVAERGVTQGETIERTTTLFTLQNESVVQVTAQVPEAQISSVRVGQQAGIVVAAFPKMRFSGRVQSVGGQVDAKTRALPVRLVVSNAEGRLKPQMFARVALGLNASRQVIAVPETALVEMEGKSHVFIEEGGKYEERKVALGARSGNLAEITSGLKPGEVVVIEGAFVLKSEASKESLAGHED